MTSNTTRPVEAVQPSVPTTEGAGVRLRRVFGRVDPRLDPFLLLDDFRSDDPDDYIAGFPWHPHRGMETISYLLHGALAHGDSLGNTGDLGPGDVQWMTAGSGIIHEEMPRQTEGLLHGFQLWANLPAAHKMMAPRYQDVPAAEIPEVTLDGGVVARVICGEVGGTSGPVRDIVTEPTYLDLRLPANGELEHPVPRPHNAFAYLFEGEARFGPDGGQPVGAGHLVIFGAGDGVQVRATDQAARLLLVAGRPLGEPVAWGGPIVMNTDEELRRAFADYQDGTFLDGTKSPSRSSSCKK